MYIDLILGFTLIVITALIIIMIVVNSAHLVSSQSKHKPLNKVETRAERRRSQRRMQSINNMEHKRKKRY